MKNKSLVWPPVKPIEDITYPTASPIWIDPNPVLDKRPRHNVREKRTTLQEAAESLCGSRCGSRCASRYEEREYERYSSSSRLNNREISMDRASCSQPFYRKVETSECRRECRAPPVYTPRPCSADGVRRSLTPTRISQPIPRPWMATVTSGTSVYGHVEPPPQPEPETICRQVCRCQIICERTSGPQGPEHEQQHTYREVSCEVCRPPPQPVCPYAKPACPYAKPEEPEPQEVRETDSEVVDLSKVVPPDVATCPKGVESQHNLFTETMEKDVGDIHIKKTTIYEKTVELMSPERARSPEVEDDRAICSAQPCQATADEEICQRSSATLDREVENISDRRSTVESTEVLTSAIDTARLIESARKEEEEKQREYERICQEEQERLRRQELECQEQERRYEEEKVRRKERREAIRGGPKSQVIEESCKPTECYSCEKYVRNEEQSAEPKVQNEERYRELTEEIKIQEDFQQLEEERRQSLREQVEVHQSIREQQTPEKRPSLQERRLSARFRDTPAEREAREQQQRGPPPQQQKPPQQQQQQQSTESCQRKHVQFMTQTETETRQLPPSTIKNATPKEWKSEMVNALTTAPSRPYSPFDASSCQKQEDGETTSRTVYSQEIRYEETCRPCPRPPPVTPPRCDDIERPVSPFQAALMTAPERPYTPLGRETGEGYDTVICVDRSQTPVDSVSREGYCHPAEILYTDDKTREARSRERKLKKVDGPQPLPTPPSDYRLRDASPSPARSLSRPGTPKDRSLMTGLKKPGTIPSYQRYLVSMEQEAVEGCPYVPSRSPTPNRTKSPAQGPPEPPACFARAQAPRIRESPPPCKRTSVPPCQQPRQSCPPCQPPDRREYVSYHMEEDTPSGHRAQAYHGVRSSYHSDDSRCKEVENVCKSQRVEEYERSDGKSTIAVQREENNDPSCRIGKENRVQPSLACPLTHCSGSERFPKTGVRVLPPCPPMVTSSQTCETRRICHEERTISSNSSAFSSQQGREGNCPNSGVTIMPCKATSGSGTKAGIVIMPCEDSDNSPCSRAGICVTPTPDRSGVCVSPIAHGKSATNCSKNSGGQRSGGCTIDIGNCPASGVRVAACGDSVCVAPCSIPGYAPVQCPKPILKSPCPRTGLPFPQIPLPCEPNEPQNPCDSCPLKPQPACQQQTETVTSSCTTSDQSFQPIREPRTNLGQQLTRLTVRRDKHVVQLFKPQAQSQNQCLISSDTQCQSKTQCQNNQIPGPNCNTQKIANPPNLSSQPDLGSGIGGPGAGGRGGKFAGSTAPKRGRGILNQAGGPGSRQPLCGHCNSHVR